MTTKVAQTPRNQTPRNTQALQIDCADCVMRGPACNDCVVSVLLGDIDSQTWTVDDQVAVHNLSEVGLLPPLRLVRADESRSKRQRPAI